MSSHGSRWYLGSNYDERLGNSIGDVAVQFRQIEKPVDGAKQMICGDVRIKIARASGERTLA